MYFFSIFSIVHLQWNGISAVYDFYFNGKRKKKRRRKKSYIIERLEIQEKKRKSFLCRLPRFADFHIIFESSFRELRCFFFFALAKCLCINIFSSFILIRLFQLLNFLNNILFLIIVVSLFTSMLYNMLSNLIIFSFFLAFHSSSKQLNPIGNCFLFHAAKTYFLHSRCDRDLL